jgi:hypothetical protein
MIHLGQCDSDPQKAKQAAKAAAKEKKKGGIQKKNAKDDLKKAARPGSKPS